jgi:hypothetical protein
VSDLSSLENLHDERGTKLKRSQSAEQLNNDVRHSLQTTGNNASVRSRASDSTIGSIDDYLQPYAGKREAPKSVKKIAIVNPTTHVFPEEENDVFEECLYQNVEVSKNQGRTAESCNVKEGSIYQNVESLSKKVNEKGNQGAEYQNIDFSNVSNDSKLEPSKKEESEFDYECVQGLAKKHKTEKIEPKNDSIDGRSSEVAISKDNLELRKVSNSDDKVNKTHSPSVYSDASKTGKQTSPKPPKKPKPDRPPPPKFSTNLSPFRSRYTSPDLLSESRFRKPPEKCISVDGNSDSYTNDPGKIRENKAKIMFRNARSASEQIVRRSEKIDDYLDMSNSRPGEVVLEDGDDYTPMSLEDKRQEAK